jgi:hypothetical protein
LDYIECDNAQLINKYCNEFWTAMEARNDQKGKEDASSMFTSIKGAAATASSNVGRRMGGAIWVVVDDDGVAVGLMRLKNEGEMFHLLNLVGVPKAGGGAALLLLAKAIALSLDKPLKLEAADEELIGYYKEKCFNVTAEGSKVMVWTGDK